MPNLTLFQTTAKSEELSKLIKTLKEPPTYGFGREVEEDKSIPGKYLLMLDDGLHLLDSQSVRVIEQGIISGEASNLLEETLRKHKISYKRFDNVQIDNPNEKGMKLPAPTRNPEVVYSP